MFDFGVLGIIMVLTGYTVALRAAWKNGNYFLTFALVLCLIHGAIAPSLLSHTANAFLFAIAPFSVYCVYSSEEFLRRKASFYGRLEPVAEKTENASDCKLVSVIVPVYNVVSCIKRTLDCVLKQDYKNLEILLIDDGSTDGSAEICDEYAKTNGRIRVIHAEHAGIAAVRNRGLLEAHGAYIAFVDSDDIVTEDYVSYMYRLIKKDDSARFSACGVRTVRGECIPFSEKDDFYRVFNVDQALESVLYDEGLFLTVCGKLFRAEFVKGFTFPNGRLYEDTAVLYKIIDDAVKVVYGQQPCYYYISRENSISTAKNYGQKDVDYQEFTENMLDSIEKNHPSLKKPIARFRIYYNFRLMRILLFSDSRNTEKENEIWNNIKKLRFKAIADVDLPVRDVFAICVSLFGKRFFRFC